jgi:hypothetical protein
MEKLDRLDWAEGLALSAFGVRVGVRVNVPGVLSRVLPLLPPGWKKSRGAVVQRLYSLIVGQDSKRPGMRRLHVLYADITQVTRGAALEQVLEGFEADLHRYIAEASSNRTFLHAGVVGWQGRAIVIPGRSFSGKTTLVREMLRLGATYYSDEFAVVDNSGLVHPFARPLGIREEEGSYAQTKCTAEGLGATPGVGPLPVGMTVICEYQKGAQWQPAPLSQGQGALELLANSVAIRNQPRQTLIRVHELARQALFFRGTRGEAREAAASILNLSCERERLEMV